jgi:hypothetical protein
MPPTRMKPPEQFPPSLAQLLSAHSCSQSRGSPQMSAAVRPSRQWHVPAEAWECSLQPTGNGEVGLHHHESESQFAIEQAAPSQFVASKPGAHSHPVFEEQVEFAGHEAAPQATWLAWFVPQRTHVASAATETHADSIEVPAGRQTVGVWFRC